MAQEALSLCLLSVPPCLGDRSSVFSSWLVADGRLLLAPPESLPDPCHITHRRDLRPIAPHRPGRKLASREARIVVSPHPRLHAKSTLFDKLNLTPMFGRL